MDTESLIAIIESIIEDESTPKQVSNILKKILIVLKSEEDLNTKTNKCIHHLEELESNGNVEAGIRVQLLDLASALEQLEE